MCLAEESDIFVSAPAVVTGWGEASAGGGPNPKLRVVVEDVMDTAKCANSLKLPLNASATLCTSHYVMGACAGDIGSPLVTQVCPDHWVLIGVLIRRDTCNNRSTPGLYSRVPVFRSWIDEVTSATTC
ncbi:chymotrypsin B-like [Macrobrachium rosenbergii]|uniref:chymotrypsin B-like n=1 Tax=Macrobrachium rosenbergii TaxID=79674 RepID=UPI0034D7658A